MNHLLDDEEDIAAQPDRELTLSTGSIVGIFFGLVLLCGAFFGFGYKMGSHKASPLIDTTTSESAPSATANFNSFKPAAGSPSSSASSRPAPIITQPAAAVMPTAEAPPAPPEAAPIVHSNGTPAHGPISPAIIPPVATVPGGAIFVQVAAVSHQEDAELLLGALKAKGYPALARNEPQDKLFHVQVGPFNNKKDAESAKQRLIADGYQPILK
jgi:DedD protein